jgi:hypothetical protein
VRVHARASACNCVHVGVHAHVRRRPLAVELIDPRSHVQRRPRQSAHAVPMARTWAPSQPRHVRRGAARRAAARAHVGLDAEKVVRVHDGVALRLLPALRVPQYGDAPKWDWAGRDTRLSGTGPDGTRAEVGLGLASREAAAHLAGGCMMIFAMDARLPGAIEKRRRSAAPVPADAADRPFSAARGPPQVAGARVVRQSAQPQCEYFRLPFHPPTRPTPA